MNQEPLVKTQQNGGGNPEVDQYTIQGVDPSGGLWGYNPLPPPLSDNKNAEMQSKCLQSISTFSRFSGVAHPYTPIGTQFD